MTSAFSVKVESHVILERRVKVASRWVSPIISSLNNLSSCGWQARVRLELSD